MIINRLTKYIYLMLFCEDYKVKQLKHIILNRLIQYHEILKRLTSDKDKLFTFKYWQTFISMLEIRLRLFEIYHTRTNKRTKQMNQISKQSLHHYIIYYQDNWIKLLSMTRIAINNKILNITKISFYFINYGRKSNLFEKKLNYVLADSVTNWVKKFKNIREKIQKMHFDSEKYINKRRKEGPQLKEKNEVYLLIKTLTTKKVNKKLNYMKIESFFIKAVKEPVSYKLNLSKNIRIYSIFHINMLKSADLSTVI